MANVKIKVDPQETNGVKLNTTATAMTITAIGDIGSGDGSKKPNIKYYFKDLQNDSEGNLPITAADLEGLDYSTTLTAEINGVKCPAEYYYHPRGYVPYFSIYPTAEMIEKYNLWSVDMSTHSGSLLDINVGDGRISSSNENIRAAWKSETGISFDEETAPILIISIYEETAPDDEFCVIGIVYDSESEKWKIDDDNPVELLKFIMGWSNKDGYPRSYYCGRVLYRLGLGGMGNYDYDLYLNAFKTSKTVDENDSTTYTLTSSTNYPTETYSGVTDITISLEITLTYTYDESTGTETPTHSVSVKIDGSEYPEA